MHTRRHGVWKVDPEKQGLKHSFFAWVNRYLTVWKVDPEKQGLKPIDGVTKKDIIMTVWKVDPEKQGLKPCKKGLSHPLLNGLKGRSRKTRIETWACPISLMPPVLTGTYRTGMFER